MMMQSKQCILTGVDALVFQGKISRIDLYESPKQQHFGEGGGPGATVFADVHSGWGVAIHEDGTPRCTESIFC